MSNIIKLWLVSEDGQASMDMGEYESVIAAKAAQRGCADEVIEQGGTEDGKWWIEVCDEYSDVVESWYGYGSDLRRDTTDWWQDK